jgi:hypothetical protein
MTDAPNLRGSLLALDPADVGIAPSADLPRVWGALMEMGTPDGAASLVMLADGTTSLYASTGGGVIGGGQHAPVAAASTAFLAELERHLDSFTPDSGDDLPDPGQVAFRALTYSGRRALVAREQDLGERRHPESPLFFAGHEVITQLRHAEEGARRNG